MLFKIAYTTFLLTYGIFYAKVPSKIESKIE